MIDEENFSTGHQHHLDEVQADVTAEQWARFIFHEGDIYSRQDCEAAIKAVDFLSSDP